MSIYKHAYIFSATINVDKLSDNKRDISRYINSLPSFFLNVITLRTSVTTKS